MNNSLGVRQLYTTILTTDKAMKTNGQSVVLEEGVEPSWTVKSAGF